MNLKNYIINFISNKFRGSEQRRQEALKEVLTVAKLAKGEKETEKIASNIPPLPIEIYEKWASIFAERLLETVPQNQIEELCSGSEVNNASLTLLFSAFMESERMEKQKAKDLMEYNKHLNKERSH